MACFFHFVNGVFKEKKFLIWGKSTLSAFSFTVNAFWVCLWIFLLTPRLQRLSPMLSSYVKNIYIYILGSTFKSMIYLKFLCIWDGGWDSFFPHEYGNHIFSCGCFRTVYWKCYLFSLNYIFTFVRNHLTFYVWLYFSVLYSVSLFYFYCIIMPILSWLL